MKRFQTFQSSLLLLAPFFPVAAGVALGAEAASPPHVHAAHEPIVELEKLVVETTPFGRSADELAETVSVLRGPRLEARRNATLGETLTGTPGVASTYFGPGSSRPLIRGLGGERIRILTNGLDANDASGTSPDHATSIDPALIDRIEVLRGPAALLHGSSAVGGLVNVVDHQVPNRKPEAVAGFVEARLATGDDERALTAHVDVPAGPTGWQVSAQRRTSDDIEIPGFAELGEPDEEHRGVLENSAIDTKSGSVGGSWFWSRGFTGAAISALDTRYGVPGHEHEEHEADDEEGEDADHEEEHAVQIELRQRRIDTRAEITEPWAGIRSARFRFGATDYRHLELEGDEIGTRFDRDSWEARLDVLHQPVGVFEGAFGAHLHHSSLVAAGDEAFLPPSRTLRAALFALEEFRSGPVRWQLGARWENQSIDLRDGSARTRDDDAFSTSAGAVWTIDETWTLAVALARTLRAPTAQELFADGPHVATRTYEVGAPDLRRERSTGMDVSLRRRAGAVTGAFAFFVNDFDGFITQERTGAQVDGFPVYAYRAHDARFIGGEFELTWHLHAAHESGLDLTFSADSVRATNRASNEPLPRIPANRYGIELVYQHARWLLGIDLRHTAGQTRVAPLESPGDEYTLLSIHATYRVPLATDTLQLFARCSNLTDAEARPHTSYLKDIAPLPGRSLTFGARWEF